MTTARWIAPITALAGLVIASLALAEAPAGSTGECKDGTYTSSEKKSGACASHGGVKEWFAEKAADKEKKAEAKPAAEPKPAKETQKTAAPAEAAPGGGAGKVWINTSSNVYHCLGDEWYGKTKKGEYASEADAKKKGARASHGKACS
jgi:hypothetical protein